MSIAPALDLAVPAAGDRPHPPVRSGPAAGAQTTGEARARSRRPLLRPVPVPDTEPPFDDELAVVGGVLPLPRYGDPAVAGGVFAVAAPLPEVGTPVRTLRVLPGGRAAPRPSEPDDDPADATEPLLDVPVGPPTEERPEDRRARRVAELPDPRPLAGQLAQAVVEVLAGDRPITQLLTWVDERIYTELSALAPQPRAGATTTRGRTVLIRPQDRPKVRSIHVGRPAPGVAEIAARVQVNGRSRAVALRLEEWRGRWRCSALIVG